MEIKDLGSISITVVISLVIALVGVILNNKRTTFEIARANAEAAAREAESRVKIDTLWNLFLQSGRWKGLGDGLLAQNSPVQPTELAREKLAAYIDELRALARSLGKDADDARLASEITARFADRLQDLQMDPQTWVVVAMKLAREQPT